MQSKRILLTGGNRNESGKSGQWPMLEIIKCSDYAEYMGGISLLVLDVNLYSGYLGCFGLVLLI